MFPRSRQGQGPSRREHHLTDPVLMTNTPRLTVDADGAVQVRTTKGEGFDILIEIPAESSVTVDNRLVADQARTTSGRRLVRIEVAQFQGDGEIRVSGRPIDESPRTPV